MNYIWKFPRCLELNTEQNYEVSLLSLLRETYKEHEVSVNGGFVFTCESERFAVECVPLESFIDIEYQDTERFPRTFDIIDDLLSYDRVFVNNKESYVLVKHDYKQRNQQT